MSKGVLVDVTKCVGCGSCAVACKLWNDLKYKDDEPTQGVDAKVTSNNWTTVNYYKVGKDDKKVWRFVKKQCFHCLEPACASVCFSKALSRSDEGPVVYNPELCVGCRYCILACPFGVPKYQWDRTLPYVTKCQMCSSRIAHGETPACTTVCPTRALTFGERDELLQQAKELINSDAKYVKHIYGETEAGGTSWLYISDVPFEELGMKTDVPRTALPQFTHEYLKWTPVVFLGGGALFTALNIYTRRRLENEESKRGTEE
ncbi:MAG TPA: 4Fe-4S dicluster domain-containing protein [Clostridia bacterium]|nr:4Fe-4S dicluster domain-containing protein [Clostridia bacterium]